MKKLLALILAFTVLSVIMTSCNKNPSNTVSDIKNESDTENSANGNSEIDLDSISLKSAPADFSFSLVWGIRGISSYDSNTGKLVKTTDTKKPENYVTTYNLSQDEKDKIYSLILDLNPEAYPDKYNPKNSFSTPSMNIILSVKYGNVDKTITCIGVSLGGGGADEKGRKLLNVHDAIVTFLMSTDEWQELPDYEVYYM